MRKVILAIICSLMSTGALAEIEQDAKEALVKNLKDPMSVQYRNTKVISNSVNQKSYCGEYNAKNSYGGYVGFKKFSYTQDLATVLNGEADSIVDLVNFAVSGCAGSEKEIIARNPNITRDSCVISWQQLDDIVLQGKTKEQAIEAAIESLKKKNPSIPSEQLSQLRAQFSASIDATINSKQTIDQIKSNPVAFRNGFISQCDESSRRFLLTN